MRGSETLIAAVVALAVWVPCNAQDVPDEMMPEVMLPEEMPPEDMPLEEAEEDGGDEVKSYVRVLLDSDKIVLHDGTEIEGTVILVAGKAAIILTEEGEQMIPREDIRDIVRAKDKDEPVILPVVESDGFKFIVMEPVEEEELEAGERPTVEEPEPTTTGPGETRSAQDQPAKTTKSLKRLTAEEIRELMDKADSLQDFDELIEKMKERRERRKKQKTPPPVEW